MSDRRRAPDVKNYGLLVRYAARPFTRVLQDQISAFGLSAGEYRVLRAIEEGANVQLEIARKAAMDRPFVTALITKLIDKGFVRGTQNRADRRRTDLHITPSGRRLLDRVQAKIVSPTNAAAVRGIDARELATFEAVALKMIANLEAAFPGISHTGPS
jgi:MarR family transcriptional regulator, transcriptional regulator for hemolysin